MDDDKFSILLWSLTVADLKKIISDYNEKCIREGQNEKKMKGYSKLDKEGLIDFINPYLSNEEKEEIFAEIEPKIMIKSIYDATDLLLGLHKREKITEIDKISGGIGYEIKIQGFNWDVSTFIGMEGDSIGRDCSCRIGQEMGLCFHQMSGLLLLYNNSHISLAQFPLNVKKEWLKPFDEKSEVISNQTKSKDDADILFTDEYQIYIKGQIVSMKWEGQYSGSKIVDVSEENTDVDTWVSEKVVDKMLKPMKVKTKTGSPSLMKIDRYGILSKIFSNQKLVEKIIKKFHDVDDSLPSNEIDLWEFLRSDLIVDNNPDYEKIEKFTENVKNITRKKTKISNKKSKTSKSKKES